MSGYFDIHCHILPGVDDGSKDMDTSLAMLKKEYKDGIRNMILTPHFRYRMFETSKSNLEERFRELQARAQEILPDLKLYLGCELHVSTDLVEKLLQGRRLTMAGSHYVLAEFSGGDEKNMIREQIRSLVQSGYTPIIAHAERIHAVHENLDFADELRQSGALLQVNANTISGLDGFREKHFAKKMISYDLIDFVGSDAHGIKERAPEMEKCIHKLQKAMGDRYVDYLLFQNPMKIIEAAGRRPVQEPDTDTDQGAIGPE